MFIVHLHYFPSQSLYNYNSNGQRCRHGWCEFRDGVESLEPWFGKWHIQQVLQLLLIYKPWKAFWIWCMRISYSTVISRVKMKRHASQLVLSIAERSLLLALTLPSIICNPSLLLSLRPQLWMAVVEFLGVQLFRWLNDIFWFLSEFHFFPTFLLSA